MSNLKELTWEHHKNAERQSFVKVCNEWNRLSQERYATYLWNQHPEVRCTRSNGMMHGLFIDLPAKVHARQLLTRLLRIVDG